MQLTALTRAERLPQRRPSMVVPHAPNSLIPTRLIRMNARETWRWSTG